MVGELFFGGYIYNLYLYATVCQNEGKERFPNYNVLITVKFICNFIWYRYRYCYVGNWAGIVKDELLQDGFTSVWNGGGYVSPYIFIILFYKFCLFWHYQTFVRDRLLLEDICTACEEVDNSTTTISSTSTTSQGVLGSEKPVSQVVML